MLATAAKTTLRGSLDASKRAVPHLIAHKVVSTIANLLTGSGVSSPTFKSLYPIHVFDVSKQSEGLTVLCCVKVL